VALAGQKVIPCHRQTPKTKAAGRVFEPGPLLCYFKLAERH